MGMMSDTDINEAIGKKDRDVIIVGDKEDKKKPDITPIGINFSFSPVVMSLSTGLLVPITRRGGRCFITIDPGDTILALTQESIWVSKYVGGTVHSKVRYVTKGLGHISTTIDPCWGGQLLITLTNVLPRQNEIQVGEEKENKIHFYTFITVCLYYLNSPASKKSDNKSGHILTLINRSKLIGDDKVVIEELSTKLLEQNDIVVNLNTAKESGDLEKLKSAFGEFDDKHKEIMAIMYRLLVAP